MMGMFCVFSRKCIFSMCIAKNKYRIEVNLLWGGFGGQLWRFEPVTLEQSHRIASGKSPGVVCDSFPPGRWAAEVVSSASGEKRESCRWKHAESADWVTHSLCSARAYQTKRQPADVRQARPAERAVRKERVDSFHTKKSKESIRPKLKE